jgi:hypothetical protein
MAAFFDTQKAVVRCPRCGVAREFRGSAVLVTLEGAGR